MISTPASYECNRTLRLSKSLELRELASKSGALRGPAGNAPPGGPPDSTLGVEDYEERFEGPGVAHHTFDE